MDKYVNNFAKQTGKISRAKQNVNAQMNTA
jgi:hypothetical protein